MLSTSPGSQQVRDAYGPSALGQDCLLARRLVEAGVPSVTVYSVANRDWDTHAGNFEALKKTLLPATDRAVSALLEDLNQRGLLEETLVVWISRSRDRPPHSRHGPARSPISWLARANPLFRCSDRWG